MKTHILSFFKYFLLVVFFFGCSKDDHNEWQLAPDEFVFVELSTHRYANIIEGNMFTFPSISQPTYLFDKETNELSFYEFEYGDFNFENLKVIKGFETVMGGGAGVVGGGEASTLADFYDIPTEKWGLSVQGIRRGGAVHLVYKGATIILAPGEEWISSTSEIDSHQYYDGGQDSVLITIAEVTTTHTINNYGILKKSGIVVLPW